MLSGNRLVNRVHTARQELQRETLISVEWAFCQFSEPYANTNRSTRGKLKYMLSSSKLARVIEELYDIILQISQWYSASSTFFSPDQFTRVVTHLHNTA